MNPILIISGTNRPHSHALKVARVLTEAYGAANIPTELFSLTDMPQEAYQPAAYANKPAQFIAIQQRVVSSSGLHVVTPEYNGSFPGALKYFIDLLKFPESFDQKPVAFVGEANGMWGGLRSVEQLQMVFGYRNAHMYPDRVFIPNVNKAFDAAGNLSDLTIKDRLSRQAAGFGRYVQHLAAAKH